MTVRSQKKQNLRDSNILGIGPTIFYTMKPKRNTFQEEVTV